MTRVLPVLITAESMEKVCIVGSGNWGTTVAKIIGENVRQYPKEFHPQVSMWVFEEKVNGRNLTDIINQEHENVKYLPGIKIPDNIVAVPDLLAAAKDATMLVFVVPHNFLHKTCEDLAVLKFDRNKVRAISLVKGLETNFGDGKKSVGLDLGLATCFIEATLHITPSVLMGANIASEIAVGKFSEATLGCVDTPDAQKKWLQLFNTPYFSVSPVSDVPGVELCGAIKNIVAFAAGIVDGLGYGQNTKAAVIRIGLIEMKEYIKLLVPNTKDEIYFHSCGIADLIASSYGGRNRKIGQAIAETNKPLDILEKELLSGQKLQGPLTLIDVQKRISILGLEKQFPLFCAIHKICFEGHPAQELLKLIAGYNKL